MITIPIWLYVIFSVMSAIGGFSLILFAFAYIRARMCKKAEIEIACGRKEK